MTLVYRIPVVQCRVLLGDDHDQEGGSTAHIQAGHSSLLFRRVAKVDRLVQTLAVALILKALPLVAEQW